MNAGLVELWTSDARDAFGHRFRDVWSVRGWDSDQFPPTYYTPWAPASPAPAAAPTAPQLSLF